MPESNAERKATPGHGGYRPNPNQNQKNMGARPKADQRDVYILLAKAKAKHESYKANLAELKYKQEAGELVLADEARDAMSTMLKSVMLALDTLTEVVEREAKLSPEQGDAVERIIDRERRNLHAALIAAGPDN